MEDSGCEYILKNTVLRVALFKFSRNACSFHKSFGQKKKIKSQSKDSNIIIL